MRELFGPAVGWSVLLTLIGCDLAPGRTAACQALDALHDCDSIGLDAFVNDVPTCCTRSPGDVDCSGGESLGSPSLWATLDGQRAVVEGGPTGRQIVSLGP